MVKVVGKSKPDIDLRDKHTHSRTRYMHGWTSICPTETEGKGGLTLPENAQQVAGIYFNSPENTEAVNSRLGGGKRSNNGALPVLNG